MAQVPLGARHEMRLLVTEDIAIDFLGVRGGRVLSTPHLIGYLEWTSRNAIKAHLEDGYDSVGTHVDVKHLAATPVGMCVKFTAEVISADERRVRCRVEAHDDKEKVAEGTHERAIVNIARFAERVQSKARE